MSHRRVIDLGRDVVGRRDRVAESQATSQVTTTTVRGRVEVIGAESKGKDAAWGRFPGRWCG